MAVAVLPLGYSCRTVKGVAVSDKPRKSAFAWAVSAPALIVFTVFLIAGLDNIFAGAREGNVGYLLAGVFITFGSAYVLWRVVVAKPRADVPRAIRKPKP